MREGDKMHEGQTIFSQVMNYFPTWSFRNIVARYGGDKWVRDFSCRSHFNTLAFAQLTGRESLRDIETCLNANRRHLHHMGIQSGVSRNNIAHANEVRDWHIYKDVSLILIARARALYAGEELAVDLENAVYAFDSTTIDLCLSLFPWADFRTAKAGIKMHTAVDVRGSIPSFIHITEARMNDVRVMDELPVEAGAFYLMDRGYLDFARLHSIHSAGAFFVMPAKRNLDFKRRYSSRVDKSLGLKCDQRGILCGVKTSTLYPDTIRVVSYCDAETGKKFRFLTNNMICPAIDICKLYKMRWQVEIFFKWIKQHLKIKHFIGNSINAVHIQLWVAVASYALVAILKKELRLEKSMYEILQFLCVSIFEKYSIIEALSKSNNAEIDEPPYLQGEFW